MKRMRLRSGLITFALLLTAALGWLYLAPSQIGGPTAYVITHGTSMEPRFHTGDLALVRPADHYRVGDITAYHSKLLHVVVLHRTIAIRGGRYVFKGDNNNFVDPGAVGRSALIGVLWLRVPHGGWLIRFVDSPPVAAGIAALAALLVLFVGGERRRRRRRRPAAQQPSAMSRRDLPTLNYRALLVVAAAASATFLAIGVWALSRPASKPATAKLHFNQQATFGYGASVAPGFVYPSGLVRSGDPIFLSLVRRIHVDIAYRVTGVPAIHVLGSWSPVLLLSGPSGWHRAIPIGSRQRFRNARARTSLMLDLAYLRSLVERVGALTHLPGASYTIGIGANVHIVGNVAGSPVDNRFQPALNLQFTPQQLQVLGATGGGAKSQLSTTSTGTVIASANVSNAVSAFGVGVPVSTLRWIAGLGFVIAGACAVLLSALTRMDGSREELTRIQAKYGHLIVPVVATDDALSWVPFDVPNAEALVRIAEAGGRVILHHQDGFIDTLLVQDDSAVYRYQIQTPIKWGGWSAPSERAAPDANGATGSNGVAHVDSSARSSGAADSNGATPDADAAAA